MHLICTIFLALMNEASNKIENNAFKAISTIILLSFVFVMAYIPAVFLGFEYYSILGDLGLNVNVDFLMFISALTIPLLFSKPLSIQVENGFSFWMIITYLFSLSLSANIFISTIAFLFVWIIYFYFFDSKKSIFEKVVVHVHLFIAFLIYREIFLDGIEHLSRLLYLTTTFLLVNQCKKLSVSKLTNSSVLMFVVLLLYGKSIYQHVAPSEIIVSISIFISVFILIDKNRISIGMFTMMFYFFWLLSIIPSIVFVFWFIGSIFWNKKRISKIDMKKLTNLKFVVNVLYLLPVYLVAMIMLLSDLSDLYLVTFLSLFFIAIFILFKIEFFNILFNNKSSKSYVFGITSYVIGFIVFWVEKL